MLDEIALPVFVDHTSNTSILVPDGAVGVVRVLVLPALLVIRVVLGPRLRRSVGRPALPRRAGLAGGQGRALGVCGPRPRPRPLHHRLVVGPPPGHQPRLLALAPPALAPDGLIRGAQVHSRNGPGVRVNKLNTCY